MHHSYTLLSLAVGTALAAAWAPAAHAQTDGDKTPKNLDRIQVTGSAIRSVDIETQQPIIAITRSMIEHQGFTTIADLLQNLTSTGAPAISRARALASGENVGGYYADIRNLGATRTLVLVNGKRLGATTGGLQDLSQIPMSAVERIDVLKDGASALYGSDAIAGVVNIITRKDYDGLEVSVQHGQFSQGDGKDSTFSLVTGARGERGGYTLALEYQKSDPVFARDRSFSKHGGAGPGYPGADWSNISQNGSWCAPALYRCNTGDAVFKTLNRGGNPKNPNDYHPITPAEFANGNEQMLLQTGIERRSLFLSTDYALTDQIKFSTDIGYNERVTDQQIAGYPYQSTKFGTPLSAASVFNPVGRNVEFNRRLWELPRTTESKLKSLRIAPSLSGYFELATKTYDWEVGALFNRNEVTKTGRGDMSLIASRQALGASYLDANGVARCGTAASPVSGCLAWNPLLPFGVAGAGSLSDPELQRFLFPTFTDTGITKTRSYFANISGPVIDLPAGELSVALGYQYRKEEGRFVPDAFAQSRQSTALGASTTAGDYSLNEFFAEVNVPVLRDLPFAKELTVNLATRYSDYSNFGSTTNSKASFAWRPIEELMVRGTFAEGFRAPSISDLYGGLGTSFETYVDPCGTGATNSVNGNAACNAAGVPLGYQQLNQSLKPCASYPCATPDEFTTGSNPKLRPEESKSRTVGVVWSPRWVDGLDINLDWYSYKITNMIIQDSVDRILRDCYVLGNAPRCGSIKRAGDGHITSMFYGLANLGAMETEGWDLGIRYRLPEFSFGRFTLDLQNSYVSRYDEQNQNSAGETIMMGRIGQPGIFRLRSNLGVNWQLGNFTTQYTLRYYSGMVESCVPNRPCTLPDRYAYGEPDAQRRVGGNAFHDIQVSYKLPWNGTVALGSNNVFNHQGPIMFSKPSSSFPYYGGFDIGRTVYVKYSQRF
ncbi:MULTISPECIES: TonB-dependent receptor domain-containing protein [Stenotrophomonas]|uniref:TonB-dependent receptor n=1 Tax=Stenotrophomonas maltophilia TaxID=40324 RepID=A0A2J0UCP5_STEMA|nr:MULTISPECIES: TonB-dependent receptor [Stenotrophomonas]PJL31217.1 TonB-dependent receptor [Stenotrophomonas maltophilia]HDS1146336.1 TonB-dependent receptor [Stenotrophomonas maltophilia]HDS1159817.1 TonB-dependent receptor [Stenotrophomonas maltophilia]